MVLPEKSLHPKRMWVVVKIMVPFWVPIILHVGYQNQESPGPLGLNPTHLHHPKTLKFLNPKQEASEIHKTPSSGSLSRSLAGGMTLLTALPRKRRPRRAIPLRLRRASTESLICLFRVSGIFGLLRGCWKCSLSFVLPKFSEDFVEASWRAAWGLESSATRRARRDSTPWAQGLYGYRSSPQHTFGLQVYPKPLNLKPLNPQTEVALAKHLKRLGQQRRELSHDP